MNCLMLAAGRTLILRSFHLMQPLQLHLSLQNDLLWTYLILGPLVHHLRPFLLNNHLLLTVGQRPRHAQEQCTCAHYPQRLAAEQQPTLCPARHGFVFGTDRAPG